MRLVLERRRRAVAELSLQDYVPAVRSDLESPRHLSAFTDLFERSLTEEVRALTSTPPQHYKTFTAIAALTWLASRKPRRYMYVTYSHDRAVAVQQEAFAFAQGAGISFEKASQTEWMLRNGASIRWLGFDGAIGGHGVDGLVLVDDPYKGMEQARSEAVRRHIEVAWRSIIWPRMHPGASVVMISTRWGLDDLFGTLERETFPSGAKWEVINLPALSPEGYELLPCRADCPPRCSKHRPRWWLEDKRAGMDVYSWEAEYMGRPRPEGMAVFGPARTFDALPRAGLRRAIGVDLAYSERASADWAVAVVLGAADGRDTWGNPATVFYVERVIRGQVQLPAFARSLAELKTEYPTAPFFTFYGGQEKVIIKETLNRPVEMGGWGLGVRGKQALADKLSRAQAVAGAWNAGRVLVPSGAAALGGSPYRSPGQPPAATQLDWLGPFLGELGRFTGTEADKHDDQVDALAAAHFALTRGQPVAVLDTPTASQPSTLALANGSNVGGQTDLAIEAMLRQQGL